MTAPSTEPTTKSPRPLRALILEDDPMLNRILATCLRALGLEVEAAANAQEARATFLAAATAGRGFDLGLFDLALPGSAGGLGTARALQTIAPATRFVAMTGRTEPAVREECLRAGFCAVLQKPFSASELSQCLAAINGAGVPAAPPP